MLINTDAIVTAARQVMAGVAQVPRRARSGLQRPALAATAPIPTVIATSAAAAPPVLAAAAPAANAVAGEPLMMPFGDLTVSEGKLIRWVKQVGEAVAAGELVVEIETDKAVVEVESPCDGVMAQHLEQEGSVVKMGQQIGVIAPAKA